MPLIEMQLTRKENAHDIVNCTIKYIKRSKKVNMSAEAKNYLSKSRKFPICTQDTIILTEILTTTVASEPFK